MATTVLKRSNGFLRLTILNTKLFKSSTPLSCFSNSSRKKKENDDHDDFFGIPSDFRLQHSRMDPAFEDIIQEQYFGGVNSCHRNDTGPKANEIPNNGHFSSTTYRKSDAGPNIFDEQYFEGAIHIETRASESDRERQNSKINSHQHGDRSRSKPFLFTDVSSFSQHSPTNFIEEQYFENHQEGSDIHTLNDIYNFNKKWDTINSSKTHDLARNSRVDSSEDKAKFEPDNDTDTLLASYDRFRSRSRPRGNVNVNFSASEDAPIKSTLNHASRLSIGTHRLSYKQNLQEQEPVMAHDVAVKIRRDLKNAGSAFFHASDKYSTDLNSSENFEYDQDKDISTGKKRDSKGFRLLSDQLLDLDKVTTSDILLMLRKKIIFDHDDFMAIEKPYGLPSLDNKNDDRHSLVHLLPDLCKLLPSKYKASNLHLVQGLDRDVTGAVLLAKNEENAHLLRGMFNSNEIIQRFWAITKGVPNPRAGLIDIPIGEAKVGNIYKMVLRPLYSKNPKFGKRTSKMHSFEAVTEFKVLASHQEAALVECQPHTKLVRHQIRVHLSNGLNTPILGDHKYSHFSKLAPQKLHCSTLELLHVRQAKVRHLALHLHCHSLVLPSYKGKSIFIPTSLPPHFFRNMKSLKLSLK